VNDHKLEVNPTTASSSTNHAAPFSFTSSTLTYRPTVGLPTYKSTSYSFTASVRLRHCESPLSSSRASERTNERTNCHLPPHTSAYSYSIRYSTSSSRTIRDTHTRSLRNAPHRTVLYCSKLIPSRHAQPSTAQHPPYCTYQLVCPACPARELRQQAFESIDAQPAHQDGPNSTHHSLQSSLLPASTCPKKVALFPTVETSDFVQTVVPSSNQQPGNQSLPRPLVLSPPLLTFRCYCCCSCSCKLQLRCTPPPCPSPPSQESCLVPAHLKLERVSRASLSSQGNPAPYLNYYACFPTSTLPCSLF